MKVRLTKRSKKVAVYKDGILVGVYRSITEAGLTHQVSPQNVWKVCATGYSTKLNGLNFMFA